jgi:transforming growth factor-beta-induced protein
MKKRLSFFALLLAFAMIVAACSSDSEETTTTTAAPAEGQSVLDLAIEAGQFSTLIAAIDAAGLSETLQGEGPFTVFAPTDAAFEAAFEALGITAEELLADTETLTAILTYHVLGQEADSQLVATLDGSSVETLNGQSVDIAVVDGQVMVNQATVVSADLAADNGIVHVIDAVLLPPDIAEALGVAAAEEMEEETTTTTEATTTTTEAMEPTIAELVVEAAAGDPAEFTVLLAALETAGLVKALSGPGPFTVFAPTDAAFGALLEALGVTAEELLANPDLANILLYHVVSGAFMAADVIDIAPADVPTLYEGNDISIAIVDGNVVINEVATVVIADVMASNGVVHVIDAVLVPAS